MSMIEMDIQKQNQNHLLSMQRIWSSSIILTVNSFSATMDLQNANNYINSTINLQQ